MELLVPVLTVLMSGVTSTVVTHGLNVRHKERDFRRQKLEALFLAANAYCKTLGLHFLNYLFAMRGKLTLNQLYDRVTEQGARDEHSFDTLRMLVVIYFPAVLPALDELLSRREEMSKIVAAYERAYKKGDTDGSPFLERYQAAFDSFSTAETQLKRSILAQARQVNKAAWRVDGAQEPSARVLGD